MRTCVALWSKAFVNLVSQLLYSNCDIICRALGFGSWIGDIFPMFGSDE